MKAYQNITIPVLLTLLLIIAGMTACEKSAPLSIDPVELDMPFTFEPLHGYPGQAVRISGSGLGDVQKVSFASKEAEILQKSDTQIMAEIPVGAISGKIRLVKANSVITSATDFSVDESPVPSITGFSPAIAGSEQQVSITGNLLNIVDSVYIGELKAGILSVTGENAMEIITPDGLQTGYIRLFYMYMTSYGIPMVGESRSATQLSLALPSISSYSKDISSLDVGDELVIYGDMFSAITKVEFGDIEATFTLINDGELTVIVPPGATTGKIVFTVPDGTVESSGSFQVNLPTIASFTPTTGQNQSEARIFSITGTRFDLVESVTVGGTEATIVTMSPSVLTITVSGGAQGQIGLHTANGVVLSAGRFILSGDFWVIDFDNEMVPMRMTHAGWDGVASSTGDFEVVASGEARGNYGVTSAVMSDGGSPRLYLRADGTGANPPPDRFLLYTDNSEGVFFEFDISFTDLPASMMDAEGYVSIKMHMFAADQARGYGFSSMHKVKYEGSGVWQSVRVDTHDMGKETSSGGLFNNTIPPLSNRFEPNNCRIVGLVFTDAQGNAAAVGETLTVNMDNVKFVIE